jgi:hypothetical protein
MSNYMKHAFNEFRAAGWFDDNGNFKDDMQESICRHVLDLLKVFDEAGHSGTSAPYAISMFSKLAKFDPIAPLTGEDWEWTDVSEISGVPLYQNKRMGSVFKSGKDGQAYWIDGRVFWEWDRDEYGEMNKVHFTSKDSRVYIEFPFTLRDPEYVFSPTEEFPNESR